MLHLTQNDINSLDDALSHLDDLATEFEEMGDSEYANKIRQFKKKELKVAYDAIAQFILVMSGIKNYPKPGEEDVNH